VLDITISSVVTNENEGKGKGQVDPVRVMKVEWGVQV
jgi:hypothetical protein